MFSLAYTLHERHYKTALVTNVGPPVMEMIIERNYPMFTDFIYSCEENVRSIKTEPRFVEVTLKRVNVKPAEAVLIDDKEENIRAFQKAGVQVIVYKTYSQAQQFTSTTRTKPTFKYSIIIFLIESKS